ncbi:MAG: hypothetical protein AAF660_01835 [Pseudomonadota bacterium]
MRFTDDRYSGEQAQFQLAMRMIGHEARTHTIRECTGLSDDRIRKIYTTYFRDHGNGRVRRRRGKSPRQVQRFVKSPEHRSQAMSLVSLYHTGRLVRIERDDQVRNCWPRPGVELGHRLCRAFETYCLLHPQRLYNFEWAYSLYFNICYNDELVIHSCIACGSLCIRDAYALDNGLCPACESGLIVH